MRLLQKIQEKAGNPASAAPLKLAFLGDSVTHGCFEVIEKSAGRFDCIYDHEAVYHSRFRRMIEQVFPNCPAAVVNAGISGGNAVGGAERLRRDVLDAAPDLAVVCFGLNDVLSGEAGLPVYTEALRAILRGLSEAEIDAVFLSPNMMCTYRSPQIAAGWLRDAADACAAAQNDGMMDRYMATEAEVCRREKVTFCDCYGDWKRLYALGADVTNLLSNYINHPTREMHGLFAERLFEAIFLSQN